MEHIDIDKTCNSSVQMVPAYAQSNQEFMRELEVRHNPPQHLKTIYICCICQNIIRTLFCTCLSEALLHPVARARASLKHTQYVRDQWDKPQVSK